MGTTIRSSTQLYVDADFDFRNNKGINLVAATGAGQAVEYGQMITAIGNATAGLGNSIHVPVADLAVAKTVTDYVDKMLMLIESLGLYRFDAESASVSNNDTVIRPTNIASDATPGRWIKLSATITDHNLLSGLQGGQTGQYNHLTDAQLAQVGTNQTITLSGEASGSGTTAIGVTLNNAAVIAKTLTAYTTTNGTITAADSILSAIQKLGYDKHIAVTLAANSGLTLAGQTLAIGTPSSISNVTTNTVTAATHTHAITPSVGFIGNGTAIDQVLVTGSTPFTPT
ncbi:MAG: hypothetical protein ACOH2V_00175 [Candidatus Saccharimonadaceae bacterium]